MAAYINSVKHNSCIESAFTFSTMDSTKFLKQDNFRGSFSIFFPVNDNDKEDNFWQLYKRPDHFIFEHVKE